MNDSTSGSGARFALFFAEGSEAIAPDETVLWRGRPLVAGLAARFLRLPILLGYFVLLALVDLALAYRAGEGPAAALRDVGLVGVGAIAVTLLGIASAWLLAATTRYAITDRRVILQIGVALPIALTLPLKRIASADLRLHRDGSGDLPLALTEGKLAYLLIWPHARPGMFKAPQPMLRCVPDAAAVAAVLSRALLAAVPQGQSFAVEGRSVPVAADAAVARPQPSLVEA